MESAIVMGSFGYHDGVAATMLGRSLWIPAIIKVHGSDINLMARDPIHPVALRWAFRRAAGKSCRTRALIESYAAVGLQTSTHELVYKAR